MPEILRRNGWRILFYSVDRNEPVHLHFKKAEKECKFFLNEEEVKILLEYSYNMNSKDTSEISEIIIDNYEFILEVWNKYFNN